MKPAILLHPTEPTFYELSSPLTVSLIGSCVTDEDGMMDDETNRQHQLELHRWVKDARKFLIHKKQNSGSSKVYKVLLKRSYISVKIPICRVSTRILILFIVCAVKRQWQYCLINRLSTGDVNSCPQILYFE